MDKDDLARLDAQMRESHRRESDYSRIEHFVNNVIYAVIGVALILFTEWKIEQFQDDGGAGRLVRIPWLFALIMAFALKASALLKRNWFFWELSAKLIGVTPDSTSKMFIGVVNGAILVYIISAITQLIRYTRGIELGAFNALQFYAGITVTAVLTVFFLWSESHRPTFKQ